MEKKLDLGFTDKEIERLEEVLRIVEGKTTTAAAARRLGLSIRQVQRYVAGYKVQGRAALISGHRGKPGTRKLPDVLKERIIGIIREHYSDFGPTFISRKLREEHNIAISKETVRQIMIEAYLWIPRKKRLPKIHQPRVRCACIGTLVQIDGSPYDWFEGRGPKCSLLVFVDDASSRLLHIAFVKSESTFSYFGAFRQYIEKYGKPLAVYSDKAGVFRVNRKTAGPRLTNFGRAMEELDIRHSCASSGSAKGRVERSNRTLQDRLVKELSLRGISTMEAANDFAEEFMRDYNEEFAVVPINPDDAHRPLGAHENLDLIFTKRMTRIVSRNLTIQYNNSLYLLDKSRPMRRLIRHEIDVYLYPDGRLELRAYGQPVPYSFIEQRPKAKRVSKTVLERSPASIKVPGLLNRRPEKKLPKETLTGSILTRLRAVSHRFGRGLL